MGPWVSTHEHKHGEHYLCTQSLLKRRFFHCRRWISGALLSWKTKSVDPQVWPHRQECNGGPLLKPACEVVLGDRHVLSAMTGVRWRCYCYCKLSKNFLYSKLCVHKQCSQCSCSCVETLVILRSKFHVVSSLFSVLNIYSNFSVEVPLHPIEK